MKKVCAICGKEVESLYWVNDNYGIPYKGVCSDECFDKASEELQDYYNDDDIDCMVGWD